MFILLVFNSLIAHAVLQNTGTGLKCGPNEYLNDCYSPCETRCATRFRSDNISCPAVCGLGCSCVEGFLKNDDNVCVPICECSLPICNYDECYDECGPPGGEVTCDNIDGGSYSYISSDANKCVEGCYCKDGKIRGPNQTCLDPDHCPPVCPDHNAIRVDCAPFCVDTCANRFDTGRPCPHAHECVVNGCQCKPGFVLDCSALNFDTTKCSDPNSCPAPNNCASPCQPTCDNPKVEVCTDQCILNACVCKSGYILDKYNGTCIPEDHCLKPVCPDHNAIRVDCAPICVDTCANRFDTGRPCPHAHECVVNGCQCKPGFVLSGPGGSCIPEHKCPDTTKCSDPNSCPAPNNCASPCQPTCDNPKVEVCTDQCILNACVCKSGYILDKYNGTCIPKDQCHKPVCADPNASRVHCASLCVDTCANRFDTDRPCAQGCEVNGCQCNPGFVLSGPGGICIPEHKCPDTTKCSDPNSCPAPNNCASPCQPTCDNPKVEVCTDQCILNACVCKSGYILDKYNGTCIPKDQCHKPVCADPNASRVHCASLCVDTCANRFDTDRPCAQGCEVNGCQCNPGFVLSGPGGSCIPEHKCPDTHKCSDPNASPSDCASSCQPTCDNPEFEFCTDVCQPRCVCNTGYILDQYNGICIPINECPHNPCGDFAFISSCKVNCSNDYCPTTDSLNEPSCDLGLDCRPGCVCRVGYRRISVDDPTCIPAEECPAIDCTRSCEEFNSCPNQCLSGYCDDIGRENDICATLVQNCQPQCTCIDGYYRSRSTNLCISEDQCYD